MVGRRERKKKQTREALIEAASALFAERGIFGTRVEDITERVDLGKGAFYNYFPSKDALVAELVAEGSRILKQNYLGRLNGARSLSSRIEEVARLHNAFFEENPRYVLLFHQARGLIQIKDKGVDRLREVFSDYLMSVGRTLPPAVEYDQWNETDLLDFAAIVAGSIAGYRSYRIATGTRPVKDTATSALSQGVPQLMEQRRL